jgi:hypothetical protein
LVMRNFIQYFVIFCKFGIIKTLNLWKHFPLSSVLMTDLLNSAFTWDACLWAWMWLNERNVSMLLRHFGLSMAGLELPSSPSFCRTMPVSSPYTISHPRMLAHGRGCIGSSANARNVRID